MCVSLWFLFHICCVCLCRLFADVVHPSIHFMVSLILLLIGTCHLLQWSIHDYACVFYHFCLPLYVLTSRSSWTVTKSCDYSTKPWLVPAWQTVTMATCFQRPLTVSDDPGGRGYTAETFKGHCDWQLLHPLCPQADHIWRWESTWVPHTHTHSMRVKW